MATGAELWLVDLEKSSAALFAAEARTARLAASDKHRLAEITEPRSRRERELSAIALRLVLARVAGDGRYDGVAFERSATGKPSLGAAAITFNLSHSAGFALIAAVPSAAAMLGVDLQRVAPLKMAAERRSRIVAAAAGLAAEPLPGEVDGERAVIQAFVRIEAVAKASGLGLAHVLARFGIIAAGTSSAATADVGRRFADIVASLRVSDLDVASWTGGEFAAALACSAAAMRVAPPVGLFPSDDAGLEAWLARAR